MGTQLTPRETSLLICLGKGLRDKEIATELSLTSHTVTIYIYRMSQKFGLNRHQLCIKGNRILEVLAS